MRRSGLLAVVGVLTVSPSVRASDQQTPSQHPSEGVAGPERRAGDMSGFAAATMEAVVVSKAPPRIVLNLFGENTLLWTSPDGHDTFALGALDFLLTARLAQFRLVSEFTFEGNEATLESTIDVSRLQIEWQSDNFWIGAGRFHSEVGFWNNAYHHGLFLQLPIKRPRVLRFEEDGGLIPVHWVGVVAAFQHPLAIGKLRIAGGFANTRARTHDLVPILADSNDLKAINLLVEFIGVGLPDLRFGVSGVVDPIAAQSADVRPLYPNVDIEEIIANAFVAYTGPNLTMVVESYLFDHETKSQQFLSYDMFGVLGYRVGSLTPYIELDYLRVPRTDPYFSDPFPAPAFPRSTLTILGLRWEINDWSALKLEYSTELPDLDAEDKKTHHTLAADWSFGI